MSNGATIPPTPSPTTTSTMPPQTLSMDGIKRILHIPPPRPKWQPGEPPKPRKAYCRYPGCGLPFHPRDKLDEFCSRQCLQDFNYCPPAPWFPEPTPQTPTFATWWRRRRNVSGPLPVQERPPSVVHPAPPPAWIFLIPPDKRRKQGEQRPGHQHSHSHNGFLNQRLAFTPSPPPPPPPPKDPPRGGPPAQPPLRRGRTLAALPPRPPSTKFRNMPLPPIHSPETAPPLPSLPHPQPQSQRHRTSSAAGPSSPPVAAQPKYGHARAGAPPAARLRPNATARRGPRPRSNSFGGFRFPAPPQH
ncbi:hypothetical protein OH77DRAFT_1422345 [Trametes cingulata]|nr:hypothetical protein OH77DRAFT_1422345 [Trametes cingulata]